MSEKLLSITDVALICESGMPAYTPYGYLVGAEGKIYALTYRWFHGVVIALLYPELAAEKQYPAPAEPRDEVDVFAYQRFEHENSHDLPVIRIAVSQLTDSVMVSKGGIPATDEQLDALQRIFRTLGRKASDTLTGEEDDMTVAQYIEYLRQERVRAAMPDDPDRYKLTPPAGFGIEGGSDE